jgi:hypothetical protein
VSSPTNHHRRRVVVIAALICLAVAGTAAAISARKPQAESVSTVASIFKTATVSVGDLTTTETVDGSVQLSSTLTVLHRIEGQTSSSSSSTQTPSTATQQPQVPSANTAALSAPLLDATVAAPAADCSGTTVAAAPTEPTTTTAPADSTTTIPTPDTTPSISTTSIGPSPSVSPPEPPTTVPTTIPEPCATTTTTESATAPGNPVGNGGPVSRVPTGAARSASTGTSTATSSTRITQTVTSIIAAEATIHQGDVLYTVDGAPVVALDGALPAWRSLSTTSDDGADIAQLEASLVALGYDPDHKVTIDDQFDSATRTMVKAWQQGLGVETTGTVTLGSVVFLPSSATVSDVAQAVGDTVGDGDTMLTLATPSQEVVIDVPTGDEAQVIPGLQVRIGNTQGTVSRLRSANRDGSVVVEAVITPATPIDNATNGSSVKVGLTLQNESGVLIAPAEALVSRLDGTYAVQLQTSDSTAKWLTVELLGVSGGNVAVRGAGLTEGTVVLLPL